MCKRIFVISEAAYIQGKAGDKFVRVFKSVLAGLIKESLSACKSCLAHNLSWSNLQ